MTTRPSPQSPLRVLHLIDHLDLGGAQSQLLTLCSALRGAGVEPVVCALRPSRIWPGRFGEAGIPLHQLPGGRLSPAKLPALVRVAARERVLLLHAHLSGAVIAGALLGRWRGLPLVVHDHSGEGQSRLPDLPRLLERIALRRADGVIAVSPPVAALHRQRATLPPERIVTLHNWIDRERFAFRAAWRDEWRRRWAVGDTTPVIGFVGRLHPVKRVELLIEALPRLLREAPRPPVLVIAGEGRSGQALERLASRLGVSSRIRFVPADAPTHRLYSAFDLFALPSRYETFGLVLLEALASGLPVVATATGAARQLLEDGTRDRLVPPGAPERLAGALLDALRRLPGSGAPGGRASRLPAGDDGGRQVAEIVRLYRRLIDSPSAGHRAGRRR